MTSLRSGFTMAQTRFTSSAPSIQFIESHNLISRLLGPDDQPRGKFLTLLCLTSHLLPAAALEMYCLLSCRFHHAVIVFGWDFESVNNEYLPTTYQDLLDYT